MRAVMMLAVYLWCQVALAAVQFGEAQEGLSVGLVVAERGPRSLDLQIRNQGVVDVKLDGAFVWLLLAEDKQKASYSAKLELSGVVNAGGVKLRPIDLATLDVRDYRKGMKVVNSYPADEGPYTPLGPALGLQRVQAIAVFEIRGQRLVLKSRSLSVVHDSAAAGGATTRPALSRTAPTTESSETDLIAAYRANAFSARDAHARACRAGKDAVPALVQAMKDKSMPSYARMWMATSLAAIGGEPAETCVAGLVGDPDEGVRNVVAYKGAMMQSARLDAAIMSRAKSNADPLFTAWAARGFVEAARPFPHDLVTAAATSTYPRAREEIVPVLAKTGVASDLFRLRELAEDKEERVRTAVGKAVAEHKLNDRGLTAAMGRALQMPGEDARASMVGGLAVLSGAGWDYERAGAADRRKILHEAAAWAAKAALPAGK